jgi:aryl-alcohol dehydrogenase-like predicted oxidoreductase
MDKRSKFILGTVQFGLDYGINNKLGKVSFEEVCSILNFAYANGIRMLDTSSAYGDSEIVLGRFLQNSSKKFNVISKYPQSMNNVKAVFLQSSLHLKQKKLYGYLIHHFEFYQTHPHIWDDILFLKEEGYISKIGFSLYTIEQLIFLFEKKISFDILQIPYNLFDKQFESYLKDIKSQKVEIHSRSVFLQGLFFKDILSLNKRILPLKKYLEELHQYCIERQISVEQLALNYITSNPFIDGVIIGVDNKEQLQTNFKELNKGINEYDIDFINSIKIKEIALLNPTNWK